MFINVVIACSGEEKCVAAVGLQRRLLFPCMETQSYGITTRSTEQAEEKELYFLILKLTIIASDASVMTLTDSL